MEVFAELAQQCRKAKALHDRILHPSTGIGWHAKYPHCPTLPRRRVTPEEQDPGWLLDIYDFTISTAMYVEEFMLTVPDRKEPLRRG